MIEENSSLHSIEKTACTLAVLIIFATQEVKVVKKTLIISFIFSIAISYAYGQTKLSGSGGNPGFNDSEKSDSIKPIEYDLESIIKTWSLTDYYSGKKEVELDTSYIDYHNSNPAYKSNISSTFLGNRGTAFQDNDFFNRKRDADFYFFNSFYHYGLFQEKVTYYNTTTPYSTLEYNSNFSTQIPEENFEALYTRNLSPYLNVGFNFDFFKSKGQYSYQAARNRYFNIFSSYSKDKYEGYISIINGSNSTEENGGFQNIEDITLEPENVTPNLNSGASAENSYNSFYINQTYKLGRYNTTLDTITEDTIRTFIPRFTMKYVGEYYTHGRNYFETSEEVVQDDYWDNIYYSDEVTIDTAGIRIFKNMIDLQMPEADDAKYTFGKRAFLKYNNYKAGHYIPNGTRNITFSNLIVGAEIYRSKGRVINWSAYGDICLAGRNIGDATVRAMFDKPIRLKKDTLTLKAEAWYSDKSADIFQERYFGNHFAWENDFDKEHEVALRGTISSKRYSFKGGVNYSLMSNYLYNNELALPDQYSSEFSIISAWVDKTFYFSRFIWENKFLWQTTSNSDVLHLPTWNWYSSFSYTNVLSEVLFYQLGIDSRWISEFYADSYEPSTSRFYLQNEQKIGGTPQFDAFINLKLKRARFYFRYNNLNNQLAEWGVGSKQNYFTAQGYAANQATFRVGIYWKFFD